MKDKNSPHTKGVREEWVKKIWGLSDQQSDESQGRGREDHIRACLAWAANNSVSCCLLHHQPILHSKCLTPTLLLLSSLTPKMLTTPRQRASNSTRPSLTRRMPGLLVTIHEEPTQWWKTCTTPSRVLVVCKGPSKPCPFKTSLHRDWLLLIIIWSTCLWHPTMQHRWNAVRKSGTSMTIKGWGQRLLTPVVNWSGWWELDYTIPWQMFSWWLVKLVIGHYFCLYFSSIFNPTSFTFLIISFPLWLSFLCFLFLCHIHTHEQMIRTQFDCTTGHQQLDLLGYQHPKTILFLFPDLILCWNPLGHSCLLPQFKVPDFPDTEHK